MPIPEAEMEVAGKRALATESVYAAALRTSERANSAGSISPESAIDIAVASQRYERLLAAITYFLERTGLVLESNNEGESPLDLTLGFQDPSVSLAQYCLKAEARVMKEKLQKK